MVGGFGVPVLVGVLVGGVGVVVTLLVGEAVGETVSDGVAVAVGVKEGSKVIKGGKTTPPPDGVRKVSHQLMGVRISLEMGGTIKASCLGAVSGSREEFISPLTLQLGDMRTASCPTHIIITRPNGKIKMMMLQSRRF
jgi:hypothetical protein